MRILLDTHTFVWAGTDAPELSRRARRHIEDRSNDLVVSIASAWELAIKVSLGRLRLEVPLRAFILAGLGRPGFVLEGVTLRHVLEVQDLPFHHRDPFDRLLVAKARVDELPILSRDPAFDAYQVRRIW